MFVVDAVIVKQINGVYKDKDCAVIQWAHDNVHIVTVNLIALIIIRATAKLLTFSFRLQTLVCLKCFSE